MIHSVIGKTITEKTDEKRATEFLRQRIRIAIQRGNNAAILTFVSNTKGLDEVSYVFGTKRQPSG